LLQYIIIREIDYTPYLLINQKYKIWSFKNKLNFESNNIICDSLENQNNTNNENYDIWHRRLGHFNINNIKNKLKDIKINEKCKVCSCSKLKNFTYNPSNNKTSEIFELIHIDTVYSADTSIHGNKYFFTILDDYLRYGWVFFIKNKSEVFSTFIKWY